MTHRIRSVSSLIVVGAVVATSLLLAPRWAAAKDHGQASKNDDRSLHDIMEDLGDEFRTLRRSVKDADKADQAWEALENIQLLTVAAKSKHPHQVEKLASEERDKVVRAYRLEMITLIEKSLQVERAILEGRTADAEAGVKEMLAIQKDGHREFKVD